VCMVAVAVVGGCVCVGGGEERSGGEEE
jgi:hypothetical protein